MVKLSELKPLGEVSRGRCSADPANALETDRLRLAYAVSVAKVRHCAEDDE